MYLTIYVTWYLLSLMMIMKPRLSIWKWVMVTLCTSLGRPALLTLMMSAVSITVSWVVLLRIRDRENRSSGYPCCIYQNLWRNESMKEYGVNWNKTRFILSIPYVSSTPSTHNDTDSSNSTPSIHHTWGAGTKWRTTCVANLREVGEVPVSLLKPETFRLIRSYAYI